jgi:hypothetical protein
LQQNENDLAAEANSASVATATSESAAASSNQGQYQPSVQNKTSSAKYDGKKSSTGGKQNEKNSKKDTVCEINI